MNQTINYGSRRICVSKSNRVTQFAGWAVCQSIKRLTHVLCRVDAAQLNRVPTKGPLLLVSNHINFLDVPLFFTHLQPRPLVGFAKVETWDNPLLGSLFSLYGAIPLKRGEADTVALRHGLQALKAGYILGVAPEGTRSGHGRLQRGYPGIVTVAIRSQAPILPMACYGIEVFARNVKRLRRTDFHVVVGNPFHLNVDRCDVKRQVRQQITDEIMFQIAALLPPPYRGYYSDLNIATEKFLRFTLPYESNLIAARS
jgi:1-acyl-sn-glycerol-3-phosphate acyltransferase